MKSFGTAAVQYNRVVLGVLMLLAVMIAGTVGYLIIEDYSLLDSAYMASITITTVGYSEVRPLSETGKVFTIGLMFLGVGTAFYILTALVAVIIEGDLRQAFGARRMKLMIERIHDHYIVCGFGRVGEQVALELQAREAPFVVVELNEARAEEVRAKGMLTVQGDATVEETLTEAGIERCLAVIAASDTDATNTYITLTAKGLRPDAYVVARISSEAVETKLLQAGADRTISPYRIGGRRMAFAALQPLVTDFIDILPSADQGDRILAEITVTADSEVAGRRIDDVLAACENTTVLAVRDHDGGLDVAPPSSHVLSAGEIVIILGQEKDLETMGFTGDGRRASASHQGRSGLGRLFRRS